MKFLDYLEAVQEWSCTDEASGYWHQVVLSHAQSCLSMEKGLLAPQNLALAALTLFVNSQTIIQVQDILQ